MVRQTPYNTQKEHRCTLWSQASSQIPHDAPNKVSKVPAQAHSFPPFVRHKIRAKKKRTYIYTLPVNQQQLILRVLYQRAYKMPIAARFLVQNRNHRLWKILIITRDTALDDFRERNFNGGTVECCFQVRYVVDARGGEQRVILPCDVPPIHRRLQDFVESRVCGRGEEGMAGVLRGPEKDGDLGEAVFVLLAAPKGLETGCSGRGSASTNKWLAQIIGTYCNRISKAGDRSLLISASEGTGRWGINMTWSACFAIVVWLMEIFEWWYPAILVCYLLGNETNYWLLYSTLCRRISPWKMMLPVMQSPSFPT